MSLMIGLVYDLRSDYLAEGYTAEQVAEFDMEDTIDWIDRTIQSLGYRTDRVGNGRALCRRLAAGDRWDLVFSVAEGLYGRSREAQVPCLLEMYDLPYVFSDALVCAVTLDKAVAKRLVRAAGLHTADFHVVRSPQDVEGVKLAYPVFAKPLAEGTGLGIDEHSRIDSLRQLRRRCEQLLGKFRQPVLVEEFLPGREFTTGILGTGADARVIGTMEVEVIPAEGRGIYSLETKEKCEEQVRYSPLREQPLKEQVERLALASYLALECRDTARVDSRLDAQGRPAFLEVNPLPGLHPKHSDLPMIATQEGMSYPELLGSIIHSALERLEKRNEERASKHADPV
jgi:D-alanine-D-alanine ligase